MKPWLSVVLPSINTHGRLRFIDSLYRNSYDMKNLEFQIDATPDGVIPAIERAVRASNSDWLWFSNDDLICETDNWDIIFKNAINMFDDGIAMFYPNDNIFGHTFPCFPLIRKDTILDLFPSPFEKYKLDDSIRDIFPVNRRIYLYNVTMRHTKLNHIGQYDYIPDIMRRDCLKYVSNEQMDLRDKLYNRNMERISGYSPDKPAA